MAEGRTESPHPDLAFFRASAPTAFRKNQSWGVTLSVVAQGRKVARWGEYQLVYEVGRSLVVTGPAVYQAAVEAATPEEPYLAMVLRLPAPLVVKTLYSLADTGIHPRGHPLPAYVFDLDAGLGDAVVRLVSALGDPVDRKLLFPLILEEVVVRLLRSDAAATLREAVRKDGDSQRIFSAMTFIEAQYQQTFTVSDLASQVGMSPSHFAHRFRAWARVSPIQYQKQVRLQRARALLLEQGLRVAEAAREVGYTNPSSFSREFRAYFNASPGDVLRQSKGSQDRHTNAQKPFLAGARRIPTL